MLLDYIRVFTKLAALSDKSLDNQDDSLTFAVNLNTSEYIYVAQRLPFCSLFAYLSVANANASVLSIDYWNGTEWKAAVDLMDGTSVGGKTLAKSGMIQWSSDRNYSWSRVSDTSYTGGPTELSTLKVYDSYWARLKVSSALSASSALKELTYTFTSSQELKKIDVEVDSYFGSFASGKTDWVDEIITVSKLVVTDLKSRGLIVAPGQVIELTDIYLPATFKTLELIYSNLGPSYEDKVKSMMHKYAEAMQVKRLTFDADANGQLDTREISGVIRKLVR